MKRRQTLSSILKYFVLAVILLFLLFPLYWVLITSFKTNMEAYAFPPSFIPKSPTVESYINLFLQMIKYLPATIRYFINFYRNVTFFLLFCIIYQKHSPSSPSASTFSQFPVVLPSLPFPVSSNKHSKRFTIPMLQYIKNT